MKEQPNLRTISLGAGVQSTTLYLMACAGEFDPKPDAAIFADTQCEPPWVYEHLARLEREHGQEIPIHRVSIGNLGEIALNGKRGVRYPRPPVFVINHDGTHGILNRQCTLTFKIEPIKRKCRELLGLARGQRLAGRYTVEEWIGISLDEAHRMKPSRFKGFISRWPLIERRMSRLDCINWLKRNGHAVPGKSACVFCPFHDDRMWANLRDNHPAVFAEAVQFDRAIRARGLVGVHGTPYLHASRMPLEDVEFRVDDPRQLDFGFGNECEGRCGV